MTLKKTLLASSLLAVFALAGCGGSDGPDYDANIDNPENPECTTDCDEGNKPETSVRTIKAIDGYLVNAEVYLDKNANGTADADEFLGTTNESGAFTTSEEQVIEGNILIKAVAGKTQDTDSLGTVDADFVMILDTDDQEYQADKGEFVVSPFSTIAAVTGQDLDDVADELNLDPELISGDFIASTDENADKAQVYARSFATELTDGTEEIDFDAIEAIKEQADDVIGEANGESLDGMRVESTDNGVVVDTLVSSIEEFMPLGEHVYYVPMNNFVRTEDEGIFDMVRVDEEKLSIVSSIEGEGFESSYSIDGDKMFLEGNEDYNQYLYLSPDLAITSTPGGELAVNTKTNMMQSITATTITSDDIADKTFYLLSDDSTDKNPDPMYMAMSFKSDNTMEMEAAEDGATWSLIESEGEPTTITISFDEENGYGEMETTTLEYQFVQSSNGLIFAIDPSRDDQPQLFFRDEAEATKAFTTWSNLIED